MPFSKHTNELTIREIEYIIRIKDKDKDFHELYDLLKAELTRFEDIRTKSDKLENPIRNFLQNNIERSIVIRDTTRVYFLNYREQGSLSIHFKLLVMCRSITYETTRQALDYLIKETIADYFEEILERHLPVSVSVQSTDNELYNSPGTEPEINNRISWKLKDVLTVILSIVAILVSAAVLAFLILYKNQAVNSARPADKYKEKYYELLIEKKVNEAVEKDKTNTAEVADTVQQIKNATE